MDEEENGEHRKIKMRDNIKSKMSKRYWLGNKLQLCRDRNNTYQLHYQQKTHAHTFSRNSPTINSTLVLIIKLTATHTIH